MQRLKKGIEMLGYAGALAAQMRELVEDAEVLEAIEKRIAGARLESMYVVSQGQGKKTRYIAHVTLEWSHAAMLFTGWGNTVRDAVMHALEKREGTYTMRPYDPDEDLPF
jgi:hypothetical protein